MKFSKTLIAASLALCSMGMTANAAAILLTPGLECASGSSPSNPNADDVETILGLGVDLFELYKDNVGGSEEGPFAGSYSTTYDDDNSDAVISYSGGPIADAKYALVKDGNHDPIWYIFCFDDFGGWDGVMDLEFEGFWPQQGEISHISLFGTTRTPRDTPPPPGVPDGGTTLLSLGLALLGLGGTRRLLTRKA